MNGRVFAVICRYRSRGGGGHAFYRHFLSFPKKDDATGSRIRYRLRHHDDFAHAGAQHGSLLGLRHKGLPAVDRRETSNLIVRVEIEIPKNISDREKQFLREIAQMRDTVQKGFFNKVKDALR